MSVINFDPNEYNFILIDEEAYFLFNLSDNKWIFVNDRCSHRGGPLHLGYQEKQPKCLICPWHEMKYSEKVLHKRIIPLIYRKGRSTAVFDSQYTKVRLMKERILANEFQS